MMRYRRVCIAVQIIVILMIPQLCSAQWDLINEVGMFTTNDGRGATETSAISLPVDVYLVLLDPTDFSGPGDGVLLDHINGFECTLSFDPNPLGNLFVLSDVLAEGAVNLGDNSDINQGFLEYVVTLGSDFPVTEGSVLLISFQFMALNATTTEVYAGPPSGSAIPGAMSYQSPAGVFHQMDPFSYCEDGQVFGFGHTCISPLEASNFGSVKALYR